MPLVNAAIFAHPTHFSVGLLFTFCCLRHKERLNRQKLGVQNPLRPDFSAFSCDVGCLEYTGSSFKLPDNGFTPRPSSKSDIVSKLVETTAFSGLALLQFTQEGTWWEGQRQKRWFRQSILVFGLGKDHFDFNWNQMNVWLRLICFDIFSPTNVWLILKCHINVGSSGLALINRSNCCKKTFSTEHLQD